MALTNAVFGSSKYLFFSRTFDIMLEKSESITFESNLITFRGIKSGPVAFLGFLSRTSQLKQQHKTKKGA